MSNRYDQLLAKVDGMALPNIDYAQYYEESQEDNDKVKRPVDFIEEIFARMNGTHQQLGSPLPWGKTKDQVRFRSGEVTLWSGYNGHKKSMVLGYVSLGFIRANEPVCVASFEMKPADTIVRMFKQASGKQKPNDDDMENFMLWTDKKLWLYDHIGSLSAQRLYGVIYYTAQKLGVKHFVIDSLMRVIGGEQGADVMNAQKDFVTKLCDIAKELDIHIHLVHHTKKGNENEPSGRYDAKGSGAISDNVHNSLIVWSNKDAENHAVPDTILKCDKQRNGEWEGMIPLWFKEGSLQFVSNPTDVEWQWI
jgi:twinkle protein